MDAATIAAYDSHRTFRDKPFRSACYAAHTSMVFDSIGRVRVCCGNHEFILGDIRQERLDDIWNGPRVGRIREALKEYDLSLGCAICEGKIAAGVMEDHSLRSTQLIAQKFEDFPVEAEAPFRPKHLEFHLSNKCNLQCVMCFGEFSSTIRARRDKLPPYLPAYGDEFFADLRKYLPHLEAAQFLGGEPFLIPEMYRVWDMLIEDELTPACHVTTNGTVFNSQVERVMDKLPISVSVSMDGVTAKTFETIRVGAKFERVLGNFRRFKEFCRSRGRYIGINFTLSRLNRQEFVDFLLFAEQEDVDVSVSEVYYPESLSLFSLERDEIERIVAALEEQRVRADDQLRRNRQVLDNRIRELRHHLENMSIRRSRVPWAKEGSPSLVHGFRNLAKPKQEPAATRALARQWLEDWSPGGGITEIVVDVNDVILAAVIDPAGPLGSPAALVGRPLVDFVILLQQKLGASIVQLAMEKQPEYEDRILRFENGEAVLSLVRAIVIPSFDTRGNLGGATALLTTKQPSSPPPGGEPPHASA